ncbi:alkane 1-monooxygenase [Trinickia terrae]|uniref:Alkane 1-monooxygenase n=1 Tax=Trinickia terrae TaxID=2571161 RepID=A0A4U1I3I2_9BURK|nr:alkane 1-monooxygenase [Trinickia terrae]TKC87788.1 alkane 1-monooxygenase [Trinickia terrae]
MSRYIAFFLPALVNYAVFWWLPHAGGRIDFAYATLLFIFVAIPLLDLLPNPMIGEDKRPSWHRAVAEKVIPVLSLPVQFGNVFFFAWYIHGNALGVLDTLIVLLTAGILSALYGQNPAHELIHHRTRFERVVGIALFSTSFYTGAKLAHLHSHHVLVATPQDPTSAGYGKTLYQFLPGAIAVNLFGWWGGDEGKNVRQSRKIVVENIGGYLASACLALLIFYGFGIKSLVFFVLQSFLSILVLEMMNFIGHYGLERKSSVAGEREVISECHAWDCDMWFSNLVLINVQKHSDHHLHPNKEYSELNCTKNSPRLPLSYPLLFLLTLVPSLWRHVIHPHLDAYRAVQNP